MRKFVLLSLLLLALAACQSNPSRAAPQAMPTTALPAITAVPQTSASTAFTYTVQSSEPLTTEVAGVPTRLVIPALGLTLPIEAMGWQVAQVEGERQAVWEVPPSSAGWHLNSARPGTVGNMTLSGHHLLGAAVFAPLARGEITVGTQLLVSDDQGRTFLYEVTEIAPPIPAFGATTAEQEQAAAYLAPTETATLTLVTGWPDFSDTHYLFVRATYLGLVP
ncbi:MAG: class F sortase [Caldilineaceae bacterium]|nr:class F sortase [Caldilineaceae bacterium]